MGIEGNIQGCHTAEHNHGMRNFQRKTVSSKNKPLGDVCLYIYRHKCWQRTGAAE